MEHDIERSSQESPLVCSLTAAEQVTRGEELQDLFKDVQQTIELADGYAFSFPGNETWANRLLQFINGERSCCLFFTFELLFEPNQGSTWLHIRGPEGVKGIVREMAIP